MGKVFVFSSEDDELKGKQTIHYIFTLIGILCTLHDIACRRLVSSIQFLLVVLNHFLSHYPSTTTWFTHFFPLVVQSTRFIVCRIRSGNAINLTALVYDFSLNNELIFQQNCCALFCQSCIRG